MSETLTTRVTKIEEQVKMAKWLLSIVGACLVAFGGVTWVTIPERARKAVDNETVHAILAWKEEARAAATQAKSDGAAVATIKASLGTELFDAETYEVKASTEAKSYAHEVKTISDKDVCLLSYVHSYSGRQRICSLARTGNEWEVKASVQRGTVTCKALCFNLMPNAETTGEGAGEEVARAG